VPVKCTCAEIDRGFGCKPERAGAGRERVAGVEPRVRDATAPAVVRRRERQRFDGNSSDDAVLQCRVPGEREVRRASAHVRGSVHPARDRRGNPRRRQPGGEVDPRKVGSHVDVACGQMRKGSATRDRRGAARGKRAVQPADLAGARDRAIV
jgi:hypothetical protein